MRVIRDAVIIGLVIRAGLWVFNHEATVLKVVLLAVGGYLAIRFVLWFIPGFMEGFRRGRDRQMGRRPEPDERRQLVERLAGDMRDVVQRFEAAEREERYSPR